MLPLMRSRSSAATACGTALRSALTWLGMPALISSSTATAETILRGGHPWLFADSIRAQNRAGQTGELAVIYDRHDKFLAVGLYDPDSPLRVRVLHAGKPVTVDAAWWRQR